MHVTEEKGSCYHLSQRGSILNQILDNFLLGPNRKVDELMQIGLRKEAARIYEGFMCKTSHLFGIFWYRKRSRHHRQADLLHLKLLNIY